LRRGEFAPCNAVASTTKCESGLKDSGEKKAPPIPHYKRLTIDAVGGDQRRAAALARSFSAHSVRKTFISALSPRTTRKNDFKPRSDVIHLS